MANEKLKTKRRYIESLTALVIALGGSSFGNEPLTAATRVPFPVYYFREDNSLRIVLNGKAGDNATLSRTAALNAISDRGREDKFHLTLREVSQEGWQTQKPTKETLEETKTIYGDKYSIPIRLTSESANPVLEYDLVDFPGAPWRADGKCGACKCDGACGNACTVTMPSQFVSESLDPSR